MAIVTFTLAIDRGKDKNGESKGADFPRVMVFGKSAENCEKFLAKGRLVGIQGRIRTGSYENDYGNKVYTTDVIADRVEFLEWGDKPQESSQRIRIGDAPSGFSELNEDIPF